MFMCDPFGRSDPDSVMNFGSEDVHEYNYIFFFDQEPIHLNIHMATFDEVLRRNADVTGAQGAICTSERDSDNVDALCAQYGWKSYYYFFHGWAALDWYRGYDKTFLIKPIAERAPTRTFLAPNRIIAGERKHRLEMLYHIFKNGMTDNHISCPAVCPVENISIVDAAQPLVAQYPDIQDVFRAQQLPINFEGETDHPMHSCWLSLFDQAADSLLYLVTETVATGRRHHITEKTFKPIAMGMPFVLVATAGIWSICAVMDLRLLGMYGTSPMMPSRMITKELPQWRACFELFVTFQLQNELHYITVVARRLNTIGIIFTMAVLKVFFGQNYRRC